MKGKTVIGGRKGGMPEMTLEWTLKENGIDLNNPLLFKNNLQEYDSRVVFNILLAIIQKEQFCEGEMMCALTEGKIQECSKVLREFDKKYNSETIKEISISSNFVFMKLNDYWYKDLLRISEHWVSYKRKREKAFVL